MKKSVAAARMAQRAFRSAGLDVAKFARALRSPDIDTKSFYESGTVGYFDADGEFQTGDGLDEAGQEEARTAIACERDGVLVDVRLEPRNIFITARYHGISAGRFGNILVPITPGDSVLVAVPSGTFNSGDMYIAAIAANATAPIPSDWNNDRLLVHAWRGAVHIRGPAVTIESPNLKLNGRTVARGTEPI